MRKRTLVPVSQIWPLMDVHEQWFRASLTDRHDLPTHHGSRSSGLATGMPCTRTHQTLLGSSPRAFPGFAFQTRLLDANGYRLASFCPSSRTQCQAWTNGVNTLTPAVTTCSTLNPIGDLPHCFQADIASRPYIFLSTF